MYSQVIKIVLILFIVVQSMFPIPFKRNACLLYGLMGMLVSSIFIAYRSDFVLSLLLCTLAVVFLYTSVQPKDARRNAPTNTQHFVPVQKNPPTKSPQVAPAPTTEKEDDCARCTHEPDYLEVHYGKQKMGQNQTNVFDELNFKLFYNELGEQHNIQGVQDSGVSGYDSSIYV